MSSYFDKKFNFLVTLIIIIRQLVYPEGRDGIKAVGSFFQPAISFTLLDYVYIGFTLYDLYILVLRQFQAEKEKSTKLNIDNPSHKPKQYILWEYFDTQKGRFMRSAIQKAFEKKIINRSQP